MEPTRSIRSIARFVSGAALAIVAIVQLRDRPADACSGGDLNIVEITTFDPHVIGDDTWDGLFFDPFNSGFGGTCTDCATKAMQEDWASYLKGDVDPALWNKILTTTPDVTLAALLHRFDDDKAPIPAGFAKSGLWSKSDSRAKLRAAIAFVALARRLEPFATFDVSVRTGPMPSDIVAEAKRGLTHDSFLSQRYAYLALRAQFYAREFTPTKMFYDANRGVLAGPSTDLAWRARYFYAGALRRTSEVARANYELARVVANAPAVAGFAARDFQPVEQADWAKTLLLATTPREKAELWRLAGIHSDGIVAIDQIRKLDPRSNLIALLLVRELARAESIVDRTFQRPPDSQTVVAQNRAIATVEKVANELAYAPGSDRPWLMELVLGHIAARRGDVVNARVHLQKAIVQRPGDVLVASQARASLAMAMSVGWKVNPRDEDELAHAMTGIDKSFGRGDAVRQRVRHSLAEAYIQAGRDVEAEFLEPGSIDSPDEFGRPTKPSQWLKASFVKDMIVRTGRTSTEFDRFVLQTPITKIHLEHELALRTLLDGNFAGARDILNAYPAESKRLHTDPFAMRNIDCHDCDHDKYKGAAWTHASVTAHLAELERTANGTGETAANAALQLGNALYNVTEFGNARVFLFGTHQETTDTSAAERWYKRAFELSANRELKAKAAFFAAKCELGQLIAKDRANPDNNFNTTRLPTPKKWFAVEKTFADTRYYKEILQECSNFNAYVLPPP